MAHSNGNNASSSQQQQQNTSYTDPSAHSYPSPSSQPTYTYPQHGEHHDSSRTPSTQANMPASNINLPPIRSMEGQPQQQQPQNGYHPQQMQHPPPNMLQQGPPPMPQPVAPMSAYYPQPPPPGMHPGPFGPVQPMSFPGSGYAMGYPGIPGQFDQRAMTGGRHKKEIKRRTKTGCLTCRKRRIKCDEEHPMCRNCQKSKRECLGYDPIFKPQQGGPPAIQPAPGSVPTTNGDTKADYTPYNSVPEGYAPVASTAPTGATPGVEGSTAIDPALAMPIRNGAAAPDIIKVKRLRPEELFSIDPQPLPNPSTDTSPLPDNDLNEVRLIFEKQYAPELDRLLEVNWYTTSGWYFLLADTRLCHEVADWARTMRETSGEDAASHPMNGLEARVSWSLACVCRSAPQSLPSSLLAPDQSNGASSHNSLNATEDAKLNDTRLRLDVLEALLTASFFSPNRVPKMVPWQNDGTQTGQQLFFAREFWRQLAYAVSLTGASDSMGPGVKSEDTQSETTQRTISPGAAAHVDPTLHQMRNILHMLENRDVLYSIAVARFYGPKFADFPEGLTQGYNNDDADLRTKVAVAKRFIEDEAGGKGTSQVVQRLCGMALRSWTLWKRP